MRFCVSPTLIYDFRLYPASLSYDWPGCGIEVYCYLNLRLPNSGMGPQISEAPECGTISTPKLQRFSIEKFSLKKTPGILYIIPTYRFPPNAGFINKISPSSIICDTAMTRIKD